MKGQLIFLKTNYRGGVGTDWQREAIRSANVKNLQMSVSGGNSGVKYYISGGYQNDQGRCIIANTNDLLQKQKWMRS